MDGLTYDFPFQQPVSITTKAGIPIAMSEETKDYVYYYEVCPRKLDGQLALGFAITGYPSFQLPGQFVGSIAFLSDGGVHQDGRPIKNASRGETFVVGRVVGCAYRPSDGLCLFLTAGRVQAIIEGFCVGMEVRPCIGAIGPCQIEVGFGLASLLD